MSSSSKGGDGHLLHITDPDVTDNYMVDRDGLGAEDEQHAFSRHGLVRLLPPLTRLGKPDLPERNPPWRLPDSGWSR